VTDVVFSDFRCVDCSMFRQGGYPKLALEFSNRGDVSFPYRHLLVSGSESIRIALAIECTGAQGKTWRLLSRLERVAGDA
jgi:protein-disulfide isomerase